MLYVIADTHFGDKGSIIKYEGRPFENGCEMNEQMIQNWNDTVGKEDTVYHLGDVSVGLTEKEIRDILNRLHGKKKLIMGNHDRQFDVRMWLEAGFEEVSTLPVILEDFYILSHEPMYVNQYSPYANVFGHVHGNPMYQTVSSRSFCACVERTGYAPVSFEKIKEAIREKNI